MTIPVALSTKCLPQTSWYIYIYIFWKVFFSLHMTELRAFIHAMSTENHVWITIRFRVYDFSSLLRLLLVTVYKMNPIKVLVEICKRCCSNVFSMSDDAINTMSCWHHQTFTMRWASFAVSYHVSLIFQHCFYHICRCPASFTLWSCTIIHL